MLWSAPSVDHEKRDVPRHAARRRTAPLDANRRTGGLVVPCVVSSDGLSTTYGLGSEYQVGFEGGAFRLVGELLDDGGGYLIWSRAMIGVTEVREGRAVGLMLAESPLKIILIAFSAMIRPSHSLRCLFYRGPVPQLAHSLFSSFLERGCRPCDPYSRKRQATHVDQRWLRSA